MTDKSGIIALNLLRACLKLNLARLSVKYQGLYILQQEGIYFTQKGEFMRRSLSFVEKTKGIEVWFSFREKR